MFCLNVKIIFYIFIKVLKKYLVVYILIIYLFEVLKRFFYVNNYF